MNNELTQAADLEAHLSYPEGGNAPAARLTILCRKSNLVVAELDMTERDLLEFMANTHGGQRQGETRLAAPSYLSCLNKRRRIAAVRFDPGSDDDLVEGWARRAQLAHDAHAYRVVKLRGGRVKVSLIFYLDGVENTIENAALMETQRKLAEAAERAWKK